MPIELTKKQAAIIFAIWLCGIVAFCWYKISDDARKAHIQPVAKVIVAKASPLEVRNGHSVTVYYLVASDGTVIETDVGSFSTIQVEDKILSNGWR